MKLVQIEYLLDRDPIKADMRQAFEYIQKKTAYKNKESTEGCYNLLLSINGRKIWSDNL